MPGLFFLQFRVAQLWNTFSLAFSVKHCIDFSSYRDLTYFLGLEVYCTIKHHMAILQITFWNSLMWVCQTLTIIDTHISTNQNFSHWSSWCKIDRNKNSNSLAFFSWLEQYIPSEMMVEELITYFKTQTINRRLKLQAKWSEKIPSLHQLMYWFYNYNILPHT